MLLRSGSLLKIYELNQDAPLQAGTLSENRRELDMAFVRQDAKSVASQNWQEVSIGCLLEDSMEIFGRRPSWPGLPANILVKFW